MSEPRVARAELTSIETSASVWSITIAPPDGLVERSLALLRAIGWRGIFDLEFVELPGGRYATIDLNPRVYGSMALTIAAGANLPGIWVAVLEGRRPRPVVARAGVHYRWEEGEVRVVLRDAGGRRTYDAVPVRGRFLLED